MASKKKKPNKDEGLLGIFAILIIVGFAVNFLGLNGHHAQVAARTTSSTAAPHVTRIVTPAAGGHAPTIAGGRTKTANCSVYRHRPDYGCTPGALDVRIGQSNIGQTVCRKGYVTQAFNISAKMITEVYAEYGVSVQRQGQYEIDHLITLKLGGSNDISNLWPITKTGPKGDPQKDRVEMTLRRAVCDNKITLSQAQATIATDWLAYYNALFGKSPSAPTKTTKTSIGIGAETNTQSAKSTNTPAITPASLGKRTKTHGCTLHKSHGQAVLPDPACSPGQADPRVTQADLQQTVCVSGYTKKVRDVPESEKNAVYAEYGIYNRAPYSYEVDHIVSLELGGSNDIANLYPESYAGKYGARTKDKIENYLGDQICSGKMKLRTAQVTIAHDWLTYYLNVYLPQSK